MSIVVPSHVRAVVELLRGNATVVAPNVAALITSLQTLTSTRIDTEWQQAWEKPDGRIFNAITVRGDGGLGSQSSGVAGLGVRSQGRILIRCWSTTFHVANQMAQLVSQILYPVLPWDGGGWTAANTVVTGCAGISDPLEYQEPETEYHRAMQMSASLYYLREAVIAA